MAKQAYHIIASYDIHDPKRLIRVAKVVKNYGDRVLKSVYECTLTEERFLMMKERVEDKIDHMEDSVRYYFLCEKCLKRVGVSGQGSLPAKGESFVIA